MLNHCTKDIPAKPATSSMVVIKHLGLQDYAPIWQQLKTFTHNRTADTVDEIWVLQHTPVYTQGQAGAAEHIINPGVIPIVQSDRGGQVTYHGPGQLIVYFLIDLHRKKLNIRSFIDILEASVIDMLALFNIHGELNRSAPGVYVDGAKICSLGLRVRKGCTYHGLSLNVDMDLQPFKGINPCGYANMQVVQMKDYLHHVTSQQVALELLPILQTKLDLND